MTSTELRMPSDLLKKFGAEIMPSGSYKRDERICSVASSFENITESEEEEEEELRSSFSNGRSPYAHSFPFSQKRSSSLTQSCQSSPTLTRNVSDPRLFRGQSDPLMIRKNSFSLFRDSIPIRKSSDGGSDTILSPIPEVASPLQSPATFGLYFNRV